MLLILCFGLGEDVHDFPRLEKMVEYQPSWGREWIKK